MPRILNSTVPFSHMAQRDMKNLACLSSSPMSHTESKRGDLDKNYQHPNFILWINQGTAYHGCTHGMEKQSIIAQAECESQDSQEFCPNGSHKNRLHVSVSSSSLHSSVSHGWPRKKRRKRQRRIRVEKESQERDGVRGLTGVPEQDSVLVQVADSVCSSSSAYPSRALITERVSVQETEAPSYPYQCEARQTSFPRQSSFQRYTQESETECPLGVTALRDFVTTEDRFFAHGFVKDVLREDRERDEDEREESDKNEGILFKEGLQPVNFEYREGREYERCAFLKEGSFGEVFSVKDKGTGFMCAAKKVPLVSFSSEEVGSWSVLQSPRVVEFFGVVREGPSIILFMDLKSSSVGQLVVERGRLPEDLSLHYLHQVVGAIDHLHRKRVLHLDIKADNVLLSEDGKDAFLCDFGQSERTDQQGRSFCRGLKGTETHMAPEVVMAEPRSSKADVWSSCCMLLHMLNGCHPWTRYYSRPLCLNIATQPPPLREIPHDCSSHTADVIKAGLQKDPNQRVSAIDLLAKTAKALKEVGGFSSPARGGTYQKPLGRPEEPDSAHSTTPTTSRYTASSHSSKLQWMSSEQYRRDDVEKQVEKPDEGSQWKQTEDRRNEGQSPPQSLINVQAPSPEPQINNKTETEPTGTNEQWRLERDFYLSSLSLPHSPELQEQLLSCLSSDCMSTREYWDKKDSGRWSDSLGDDLSSGVFSYNSQQDDQSFNRDWLVPSHNPPRCFEGVNVHIRDFNGKCLHIRETPKVNIGHIAKGISDQISEKVFSLQTDNGCSVVHEKEVSDGSLFLRCVSAPDCCHYHQKGHTPCCKMTWSWRIKDGVLETRD